MRRGSNRRSSTIWWNIWRRFEVANEEVIAASFVAASTTALVAQDGQWTMNSGSYSSPRFSPLTQISAENVGGYDRCGSISRQAWIGRVHAAGGERRHVCQHQGRRRSRARSSQRQAALGVDAADRASRAEPRLPARQPRRRDLDDTVYVGTLDGYLVALDAKAGIERWSVHVGENPDRPRDHRRSARSSTTR
jgi:hypothetical protein